MPYKVTFDPKQNTTQASIIANATETTDGVMTAAMVRKLNSIIPEGDSDFVNVEFFREGPGGPRTDAEMLQAAVNAGVPLSSGEHTYEIGTGETIINNNSCHAWLCGNTTFRMADGANVNTDASSDNFTPFMQHRGVQGFWMGGRAIFDGNRTNSTYPATQPNFGRGTTAVPSAGRRFCGTMEFVAGADNLTPSSDIVIEGDIVFENGYLNGLVFCQTLRAQFAGVHTENNTVNGVSVEGVTTFKGDRPSHYRDGVSTQYPAVGANGSDGDRSGIQCREIPGSFTAGQLEMPFIPSLTGDDFVNVDVNFTDGYAEECQVEGWFMRMCFPGRISNCTSKNVCHARQPAASFHGAHFWAEWGFFQWSNLVGIQQVSNAGLGYQVPDGLVLQTYSAAGNGRITYGFLGRSSLTSCRLLCGYDASDALQQNYFRGARIYSECTAADLKVEGVTDSFIRIENDTNFNLLPPRNVTLRDVVLENGVTCDSPIEVNRFGGNTVVGEADGFVFDNIKVSSVATASAGTDDHAIIDFNTTMANYLVTATMTRLNFDCTNTGSVNKYNGVRLRTGAGSVLTVDYTRCENSLTPLRASGPSSVGTTGGFSKLKYTGYLLNCHRAWLIDATNWTANADSFDFDLDIVGNTDELFFVTGFLPAGNPTFKMNAVYAKYRAQGSALSRTFPAGAGNITTTDNNFFAEAAWYQWGPNNDNYGSNNPTVNVYDMKRRYSTIGNLNAAKPNYVGEMVRKTDDTPNTVWLGVTKTGTTGLWSQLAIPTP